MNKTYFLKVDENTTWECIYENIYTQIRNNCKPLPYSILTEIFISQIEFKELSLSVNIPRKYYVDFTSESITDLSGIWKCILISCKESSKNILLYTAGNIYPLYASIIVKDNEV